MPKHGKPKWYHTLFLKTWEVAGDKDPEIERFRRYKSAKVYADDLNNPHLYYADEYDGTVYTVTRRSF